MENGTKLNLDKNVIMFRFIPCFEYAKIPTRRGWLGPNPGGTVYLIRRFGEDPA